MQEVPLITSGIPMSPEDFWTSVFLYYNRPNLINRKLAATSTPQLFEISITDPQNLPLIYARENLLYELRKLNQPDQYDVNFVQRLLSAADKTPSIAPATPARLHSAAAGLFLSLRTLFGRSRDATAVELALFDKAARRATFRAVHDLRPALAPDFPFRLELAGGRLRVVLSSFEDADTPAAAWLADRLLPRLLRWAGGAPAGPAPLALVRAERYCRLYGALKRRHAPALVARWPAGTDARKYVHEDLAIAAYLMCLWAGRAPVRFVDCGCGNGLLVHVLNAEGFAGVGVDVRARAAWQAYGGETRANLRVGAVAPEAAFPEATWIIGNHSDELTPWIPVIALRSAADFFLLPCCPYDFSGAKYSRTNTGVSQYGDYLVYVEKVAKLCGFETSLDKLRIPSTKRTCIVGTRPDNLTFNDKKAEIEAFLSEKLQNKAIRVRESVEAVRNCTQIDRTLTEKIVKIVVDYILSFKDYKDGWNRGGTVGIKELVGRIEVGDLKMLKNQCGGLQTLLKNHSYLFQVRNGTVQLKLPRLFDASWAFNKKKDCWFFKQHPDGCPHSEEVCAFIH